MTPEQYAAILEELAARACHPGWLETHPADGDALSAGAAALRRGTCGTCQYWRVQELPRRSWCTVHGHVVQADDFCSDHAPLEAR